MSLNPQVRMLQIMQNLQPAMRKKSYEAFEAWQDKARTRLQALLGLPLEYAPANFRIEWTDDTCPDFSEIRFLFTSEPGTDVCCHLLLPKNAPEKLPLVICLQGHTTGMHISLGRAKFPGDEGNISSIDNDFAIQAVSRGQAALTIEQRGFGERGGTPNGPDCYQISMQALLLGRTLVGERCWDVSRAIDVVCEQFPQIDSSKIAIMGNSGGGTAAFYSAALDTRIAAAMPSCAFSTYLDSIACQYHCSCNFIPGIMNDFDMGDVAGLIAPRPLVIVTGQDDPIFPVEPAKQQADITRRLYDSAQADENFRHVIGPGDHRFFADLGWKAFDELTGWRDGFHPDEEK